MFKNFLMVMVAGAGLLAGTATARADDRATVRQLFQEADRLKRDKDFDGAVKLLDRVLAIDPNNADAWAEGAWIFNEQGKFDIAVQAGEKALGIDPNHSNGLREIGYARMKQKRYLDATKALARSIEKNRRNWNAYDYLAEVLELQNESKLAADVRALKKTEQAKILE